MITSDLVTLAYQEANMISAEEVLSNDDAQFGLNKLNGILDEWSTDKFYVYNVDTNRYQITPNHQPHLIGPGLIAPDFAAAQRPMRIENASVILTGQDVGSPIGIQDDDWWAMQALKSQKATIPTDLYYSPNVPNGQIFLWPIPTVANLLELQIWVLVSQIANLQVNLVLAPGYQNAMTLTLAEGLESSLGFPPTASLISRAQRARTKVQSANVTSPRMGTSDSGVPRGGKTLPSYNFRIGR